MFQKIKSKVSILDAFRKYCKEELRERGPEDYIPEDDICPGHGGQGSFHLRMDENGGYAKCFNPICKYHDKADVIEFTRITLGLDEPMDAVHRLAKDFNISISTKMSTTQRIYQAAQEYYRDLLELGIKSYGCLEKLTPLEYQLQKRGHSKETIDLIGVGWSDGGLKENLIEVRDFTEQEVLASGLVTRTKAGKLTDMIPSGSFTYPALVGNRVSRFTFKCQERDQSGKKKQWQIKKQYWLNNIQWMGQDSLRTAEDQDNVAVVEGENDRASLLDFGWKGAILASNGTVSKDQWDFLETIVDRNIHTFFDSDEAGDGYRDIAWSREIPNLRQYKVPVEDNDVDNFLQRRKQDEINPIEKLLDDGELPRPSPEEMTNVRTKVAGAGEIIVKNGCYYAVRQVTSPTGETIFNETQLSNFTLKLKSVFIHRGDRAREIVLTRFDGVKTDPSVFLNSVARSSLRVFKEFVARSIDGIWFGSDADLNNLWNYIALTQKEKQVIVPEYCGYVKELNMWIFRNIMINATNGTTYLPDERGIFWISENSGIMPQSIVSDILNDGINPQDAYHIPRLTIDMEDPAEFQEWQGEVLKHLAQVMGPHEACTLMGWAQANAYSNMLFDLHGFFPMFLLWGRHGKGKTTILRWALSTFDMSISDKGYMAVSALERSPVGFLRKAEYYSSLPMGMDELRADDKTRMHYPMWRGFFNRSPRTLGTARQGVVRQQPIRANLAFAGQDAFADSAMQSRCMSLLTSSIRDDDLAHRSYLWIDEETDFFPRFGYHWILESCKVDRKSLQEELLITGEMVKEATRGTEIGNRTRELWKVVGTFANRFMASYFPEESYGEWMISQMKADTEMQQEVDIVKEIWDKIAASQVGRFASISTDQVHADQDYLYVWWPGIKDMISRELRHLGHGDSTFKTALKEEPYCESDTTRSMGINSQTVQRRVMRFSLKHPRCPEIVKQIAKTTPLTV